MVHGLRPRDSQVILVGMFRVVKGRPVQALLPLRFRKGENDLGGATWIKKPYKLINLPNRLEINKMIILEAKITCNQ